MCAMAALAVTWLFSGCRPASSASGDPAVVPLFFTSETHGRLSHCGCVGGQFGGLARLRTAVANDVPAGALGVGVGDALEGPEDYHLLKYKQVVQAYS